MMNKQVRLASRPDGLPNDSNWAFEEGPVPKPREGEVLVKISHISLDPAMRAWMNEGATYIDDVKVGDVMRANTVGEVIESKWGTPCKACSVCSSTRWPSPRSC